MRLKPLNYSQIDVRLFEQPRFGRACAAAGRVIPNGKALFIAVYISVWLITHSSADGYYLEWNDDNRYAVETKTDLDTETIERIIRIGCDGGVYDDALYRNYGILTSADIQDAYFSAASRLMRRTAPAGLQYLLVTITDYPWLASAKKESTENKPTFSESNTLISEKEQGVSANKSTSSENNDNISENSSETSELAALFSETEDALSEKCTANRIEKKRTEKKRKESQSEADIPPADWDGFLFFKFYFRNFLDPYGEVRRCREYYGNTTIRNIEDIARAWTPANTRPRYDDRRVLEWSDHLYHTVKATIDRSAALLMLRNIHSAEVDRRNNILQIKMIDVDSANRVKQIVQATPELKRDFDEVVIL